MLEDAFYADLYQRHAPGLFAYAFRQTASREDAEDIVLDVFLTALQHPSFAAFDEQKQVAWLWTITRNKVVDRFRGSARQQHVPIEQLVETLYKDDELSPEREHLKHEESTQLHRAIKALPQEQKEVLQLRFGYTSGTFDAKTQTWAVRASDAHAWTQIYFAGYGWINFEPSPGFSPFTRPLVTDGINMLPW